MQFYHLSKSLSLIALGIFTFCLCACSSDVARMQKYDATTYAARDQAIVVVSTRNLSFVDFTRYTGIVPNQEIKSKPLKTEQQQISKVAESTKPPPVNVSADPNNRTYPKTKFRELFKGAKDPVTESVTHSPQEALDTYRVLKSNRVFNLYGYGTSAYVIKPGTYYISYAYEHTDDAEFFTKSPGLSSDSKVVYGAFAVKPGDVVFLGDIEFDWLRTDAAKVRISGDLSTVKQELAKDHPELAVKLQQAHFYPAGSQLHG